ncbi:Crp/Fnr family transcriptional regulator [Magnetovibrio sp.]|uniref:Crp/Fnr family transcriptional regulator n=1 Tax=Magnetovibrio sp. TaxID=2024836 RepID=UPI002F9422FD
MPVMDLAARLGGAARIETFKADTVLFHRGDVTRHMFGVVDGQAYLRRTTIEGAEIVVHRALGGDLFAEAALFSSSYHCDGIAVAGARIAWFEKTALLDMMQTDGRFAVAFCRRIAGQVQRLRSNIELRAIRSAEDRIMAALSLRLGEGETRYEPAGSWKGFAAEIGLTHEALYRALKRLEQAKRLRRDGPVVELGV